METARERAVPMHGGIHPADRGRVRDQRKAYAYGWRDCLAALPQEDEGLREALDVIEGLFLAGTDAPMSVIEQERLVERAERVLVAGGRKLPPVDSRGGERAK